MAERKETLGKRLARLRQEAGLTQQELADKVGMNRFALSRLEADGYSPSWEVVQSLTEALGLSLGVFDGVGKKPPPGEREPRPMGRPKKRPEGGEEASAPQADPAQPEAPPDQGEAGPAGPSGEKKPRRKGKP